MIAGWCAPPGAFNEWTYSLWRWSQATSIKLFPFHILKPGNTMDAEPDPRVWNRIKAINPTAIGVVRLLDSYWDWENRFPSAVEYAITNADIARKAMGMGIKLGQWDNEPNHSWGFDKFYEWRQFTREALTHYNTIKPKGFKTIFTPMMLRWDSQWKEWYGVSTEIVHLCDYLGINEYWQDPLGSPEPPDNITITELSARLKAAGLYEQRMPQRYREDLGWAHAWLHNLIPEKKIINLEVNTSWTHKQPQPEPGESYQIAKEQVPNWILRVNRECGYMAACHIFTLPGTGSGLEPWRGFWGTEILARALGKAVICGDVPQ